MLRLIVQTKERYNRKVSERGRKTKGNGSLCFTDEETGEGSKESSLCDQDSDVSFQEDEDEEIDSCETEEDWIEFTKRSAEGAQEHMKKANIRELHLSRKNHGQAKQPSATLVLTTRSEQTDQLEDQEKMGRRNKGISETRRNRRNKKRRLEKQQHMESGSKDTKRKGILEKGQQQN